MSVLSTIIRNELKEAVKRGLAKEFVSTRVLEEGLHWTENKMITEEDIKRALSGDSQAEEKVREYALAYFENLLMIVYMRTPHPLFKTWVEKARTYKRLKDLLEFMEKCCGIDPLR